MDAVHINERLRRGLGVWGGNPVGALSDELVPVVLVDDLTKRDLTASRIRRYLIGLDSGAVTNVGVVEVSNPSATTKVVVEGIQLANTASTSYFMTRQIGTGAATGIVNFTALLLDPNTTATVGSATFPGVATFWRLDTAVVPTTVSWINLIGGSLQNWLPLGLTLGQGETLVFARGAVTLPMVCTLQVSEYDPTP